VWELLLAKEWLEIEKHRVQFIEKIQNLSQGHLDAYPDLNAKLSLTYVPSLKQSPQTIQDVLRIYQKNKAQEIHTCTTLFGPHRDEIDIGLNGSKASQTASEGQKKMLIAAFSFACFDLLKQTLGTEPLFLIDDYDAHFDLVRKNWISSELKAMSQSFLTSPLTELGAHYEALFIHSGKVNKGVYTYN
jgi:DNA replication and repair protein RecF